MADDALFKFLCRLFPVALLAFLLMTWDVLLPNSLLFPVDPATGAPPEGTCGMVWRKDKSPFKGGIRSFTDDWQAHSTDLSFVFNGTLYDHLSDVPKTCLAIFDSDIVNKSSGPACDKFCSQALGWTIHPACVYSAWYLAKDDPAAVIYKSCNKVRWWATLSWLPSWGVVTIAGIYGMISLILVYGAHRAGIKAQILESTGKPQENSCREDGPYKKGKYAMPFCCFTAKSDMDASRCELYVTFLSTLIKPAAEMNTMLTYLFTGRPIYFALTFVPWMLVHIRDPFGTVPLQAIIVSREQGYPNWIMHFSKAVGAVQQVISTYINIVAVVCIKTNIYDIWAPMLSIAIAVFSSIPSTSVSKALIEKCGPVKEGRGFREGPHTLTDFYKISAVKEQFGLKKFENSCQVFGLGTLLGFSLKYQGTSGFMAIWGLSSIMSVAGTVICIIAGVYQKGGCGAYFGQLFPSLFDDTPELQPAELIEAFAQMLESLRWISPFMPIILWGYVVLQDPDKFLQLFQDASQDPMALVNVLFIVGGAVANICWMIFLFWDPFKQSSSEQAAYAELQAAYVEL